MDATQEAITCARTLADTIRRNRGMYESELAHARATGQGPDWCSACCDIGLCRVHREAAERA